MRKEKEEGRVKGCAHHDFHHPSRLSHTHTSEVINLAQCTVLPTTRNQNPSHTGSLVINGKRRG